MKKLFSIATLFLALVSLSFAQTTTTQTTLTNTITLNQNTVVLGSCTGVSGAGTNNQIQTELVMDREAMTVQSVINSTTCLVSVIRGYNGTRQHTHNASAVVWVGPPGPTASPFKGDSDAGQTTGSCVATNQLYLPLVYLPSGNVIDCIASGPANSSVWTIRYAGTPNSFTDGAFWLSPGDCNTSTANSTGTNGLTVAGASNVPVVQADSSNSGTNTHTYSCVIRVPSRLVAGRGIQITNVEFFYGVQTTGLGTQVATLASGTMNSQLVFSKIVLPAAGASETASTVTPVRADSGTLLITPVVASFNVATTTAGAFYSATFTPATPINVNTDNVLLLFNVALLNTATSATITNSPGVLVHFTSTPL